MTTLIIAVFIAGYLCITLEHRLKLDKAVSALLMATVIWALIATGFNRGWIEVINYQHVAFGFLDGDSFDPKSGFQNNLIHHFGKAGEILFFLIGAMTIVEIIDLHRGFDIIKGRITTTNRRKLLWTMGGLAFVLSAIIDNLTATIVLVTLLRKLIPRREYRVWYAAMIVIAANAGGAWSPIGDVTTTMLWINGKVTTLGLSEYVILPSLICFVVPFYIASRLKPFKGAAMRKPMYKDEEVQRLLSSKKMLIIGFGALAFVPVFKAITGLPPHVGMLFSLGVVWAVSEYVKPVKKITWAERQRYSAHKALSKVHFSSVLFFLGILLAVSGLESVVYGVVNDQPANMLRYTAENLSLAIPNMDIVVMLLGMFSAVLDNVPLVAASIAMYDFPVDDAVWHFIAYCAGTGGSLLIIGSAAGVAAMGMERIDFIWYLKRISGLAFIGFVSGAICFILIEHLVR